VSTQTPTASSFPVAGDRSLTRAARPLAVLRYLPPGAARVFRAPREERVVKTRDLAYIALFAAIVAVLGQLPAVPVPGIPVRRRSA
jgi:hypothetical protein